MFQRLNCMDVILDFVSSIMLHACFTDQVTDIQVYWDERLHPKIRRDVYMWKQKHQTTSKKQQHNNHDF